MTIDPKAPAPDAGRLTPEHASEIRARVEKVRHINHRLCETGGQSWTLSVPVRESDPDRMIESVCALTLALLERVIELEVPSGQA